MVLCGIFSQSVPAIETTPLKLALKTDFNRTKMITVAEHSDEALSADNQINFDTRHTGFALNQSKQMKNLKKNVDVINYDTVINNFNENMNLQCSSGFYLEVASPALLSLAKQTCENSQLVITGVRILCANTRINLDNHNLHVNSTYFFDLLDDKSESVLGKVTIHCHVTTRVVQLQGSKLIMSSKAPLWFFHNVLKNTFDREGSERSASITKTNEDIVLLASRNTKLPLGYKNIFKLSMKHSLRALHKYSQRIAGSSVRGEVLIILSLTAHLQNLWHLILLVLSQPQM